jgi:threonylcarbamoyladenosine tRNA methylthiotransferase MtaB
MDLSFYIKTFGCKVNQYESQVMREKMKSLGFMEGDEATADVIIVNTCTVTSEADAKGRRFVKSVNKKNTANKVFVTGCSAVLEEDILLLDSIEAVYKVIDKERSKNIKEIMSSEFGIETDVPDTGERISGFEGHTRTFLKIQDGCSQKCSYCKVSIVRGPSVSRDRHQIIQEVSRLIDHGYKEIVLTGVCLGSWKEDKYGGLSSLLREIEKIEGDFRIRLSSIEPNHIDDELIDTISGSNRICRHLHIPLQSGSDRILKLMNRRYDTAKFEQVILKLRNKMPGIGITMDLITAFPGETDMDHLETVNFLKKIQPSRLHVFGYSDRKGTVASRLTDKVARGVKKARSEELIKAGKFAQVLFAGKFIGKFTKVLIESENRTGILMGYNGEYAQVSIKKSGDLIGKIIEVKPFGIDLGRLRLLAEKAA